MADLLLAQYGGWLLISGMLILLSTSVAALVYMIGALLSNEKVKVWAKIEFVEIFYSIVLMIIVISALGLLDSFVASMVSDPTTNVFGAIVCSDQFSTNAPYYQGVPCHIRLGMEYMNQLFLEGKDIAYEVYVWYSITAVIAEANINLETIYEQSGVFAYNPLRGFFVVGNIVKLTIFDYITKILTVNKFQEVLLRFIALALFPVMFTLGIVLRSFFFTRKLGGLLMAFSLALYFIYPMFYVVGGIFYNSFKLKAEILSGNPDASALKYLYVDANKFPVLGDSGGLDMNVIKDKQKEYDVDSTSNPYDLRKLGPSSLAISAMSGMPSDPTDPGSAGSPNAFDLCEKINDKVEDFNKEGSKAISDSDIISNEVSVWYDKLSKTQFDEKESSSLLLFELADPGGYIDSASRLTFFSLAFSFLAVMATIAATKSMSEIFGGDLEIAGLTHLI
jgi:hypothetical protein